MESRWPTSTKGSILAIVAIILPAVFLCIYSKQFFTAHIARAESNIEAQPARTNKGLVSPVPSPTATVVPAVVGEEEHPKIAQEIRRVFGKHSDKAFRVLSCENAHLNPDATNVNTDGSTDWGVFQINDNWHGFNKGVNNSRYLTDYKINIAIAWRIYEGSGYNFHLWTCGKRFGI